MAIQLEPKRNKYEGIANIMVQLSGPNLSGLMSSLLSDAKGFAVAFALTS